MIAARAGRTPVAQPITTGQVVGSPATSARPAISAIVTSGRRLTVMRPGAQVAAAEPVGQEQRAAQRPQQQDGDHHRADHPLGHDRARLRRRSRRSTATAAVTGAARRHDHEGVAGLAHGVVLAAAGSQQRRHDLGGDRAGVAVGGDRCDLRQTPHPRPLALGVPAGAHVQPPRSPRPGRSRRRSSAVTSCRPWMRAAVGENSVAGPGGAHLVHHAALRTSPRCAAAIRPVAERRRHVEAERSPSGCRGVGASHRLS